MDSPLPPDPYKALDVSKDASLATIRTAHRKLVLKTHPDKVQGDEELKKTRAGEFHQIQQAYEILSDDNRRKAYDDQVKLATLRAEMMAERGGSRNLSDPRPMSGRSPIIEVRGGRIYEERAPRRSYDDSGDDFFSSKLRDSRPKYDDSFTPPSSRKSSIRLQEEKSRARNIEEERERLDRAERFEHERIRLERINAKAGKKSQYAERDRQRDQMRRKDYDIKYRHAYVNDGSDDSSDSSQTEVTIQPRWRDELPRPRYEETKRKDREETSRRTGKREVVDGYPDLDSKLSSATDYIRKASREPDIEVRRPAMHKGYSTREVHPTPSPPPREEHPRRSNGRTPVRRESPPPKLSAKKGRLPQIVDPPAEFRSRPSMPVSSSDPKGLRPLANLSSSKGKPARATTLDPTPEHEFKSPGIRRADSMPIHRSRHDEKLVSKSSKSKEYDEYSSSSPPPRQGYRAKVPNISNIPTVQEDEEGPRYRTGAPKEDKYRRERNVSQSERPPMVSRGASSVRMTPVRSTSFAPDADEPRQSRLKRADTSYAAPTSSRPSGNQSPRGTLFAEMPQTEEPYRIVRENRKLTPADIQYSHSGRYDRRGSDEGHRDWAPGSEFDQRNRPAYSRSTSRVY
ncbi:MAG: hypothetical protein LQ352_007400 [Teloschistes flavicans]|nr:MAG: hypothetical protein LQ352_007400 [Teloschistes flavicans]